MKKDYLTIKELPENERPYEKLMKYGADNLSEAELLAIILRTGTKKYRVTDMAQKILSFYDTKGSLDVLYKISINELLSIKGIGKIKAVQLVAIAELSRRLDKIGKQGKLKGITPRGISDIYMNDVRYLKHEIFKVLHLDVKLNIISDKNVGSGTLENVKVVPRDVFREAITCGAKSIILIHNHPSGDPKPSENDITTTERLVECGMYLDIKVLDHIVLGDGTYFSMRERNVLDFY